MIKNNFTQSDVNTAVKRESPPRKKRIRMLVLVVYALGLMVSPDNLSLLGRFAGHFGIYAPLLLLAGILIYFNYVQSYTELYAIFPGPAGEALLFRRALGIWLVYYPLVVRVLAAVFLTTGLTVSCGFVFNEIFIYWFPNFGFAYILLGLLSALHLLGPASRARAQIFFVGIAFLGLTLLIGAGLIKGLPTTAAHIPTDFPVMLPWFFMPLLVFIGFDMAVSSADYPLWPSNETMKSLKTAIVVFGVFMILWTIVTTQYVTGSKLIATSIPHIIAAREISGQLGRIIMGIIVIAGACGAVNALFETVSRLVVTMSELKLLPCKLHTPQVTVLFVAVAAGIMMAAGLAGDELLETYIRATLLLWLGGYGLLQMCLLQLDAVESGVKADMRMGFTKVRLLTTAIISFGGAAILVLTDARTMLILKVIMVIVVSTVTLGAIAQRRAKQSSKDKGGNHAENKY